jgi:tetratricopeptide (TPR) repeat protein
VTTPDPIEIAMEAEASGRPPGGLAAEYLAEQKRLVRWQVANERAAFALRVLTAAAGIAVAVALGAFAWQASQARGLVVDPFATPPGLAAEGVTGEVAATRLLDRIRDLEARSTTQRDLSSFANSWGDDLKVDIPQAGVSLDQVQRYLRATLGRETRITGEIVRSAEGLKVTVRAGNATAVSFAGPAAELDRLLTLAADDIYRVTQPYRWGVLLYDSGRYEEAKATFRQQLLRGSTRDRAWAYNGLGTTLNWDARPREAIAVLRSAIAADPGNGQAHYNLVASMQRLGRDGEAFRIRRVAIPLYTGLDSHGLSKATRGGVRLMMQGQNLQALGDYQGARRRFAAATAAAEFRQIELVRSFDASSVAGLHQPALARRLVAEIALPEPNMGIRRLSWFEAFRARIEADAAAEDWRAAAVHVAEARRFAAAYRDLAPYDRSYLTPMQALAEARLGDVAAAQRTIESTDADCDLCQRVRGMIAALAGDRQSSARAFAAARALGPALPFADLQEGRVHLERGDAAAAMARFNSAHRLSPRFADPLGYGGEALLMQGDASGAARRFAQAARLAPRWGRLHLKWGEALATQGKTEQARAKWRAAAAMDLTAAERKRVRALLAGART